MKRKATKVQRTMIALLGVALGALLAFLVPELSGVADVASEDTFSEWVWDLSGWAVFAIAAVSAVAGGVLVWSAGHYIEGWSRRKDRWDDQEEE